MGDVLQGLVSAGHRWQDVTEYTLGQIGVFHRAVQQAELEKFKATTRGVWAGHNLTYDGLSEFLE